MTRSISPTLLTQLSEFVAAQMGWHYPPERWPDLQRGISAACGEFGFEDAEACARWLLSAPLSRRQIETLASYLTVGETYFLREKKSFAVLEEHILPALIDARRKSEGNNRRLRIWSAGCCTGEEPYSIAILLDRVLPDLQDWQITILATDINPRFLEKATAGVFGEWSFRDAPPWLKEEYFRKTQAGRFEILPRIKKMVMFAYLNLAEDVYPSLLNNTNAMDVIWCRNVLMYLAPHQAKNIIDKLYRSLVEGGWLSIAPSETSHLLLSQFVAVNFPGATLYQKRSSKVGARDQGPGIREREPPVDGLQSVFEPALQPMPWLDSPVTAEVAATNKVAEAVTRDNTPAAAATKEDLHEDSYQEARALYEQGYYAEAVRKLESLLAQQRENAPAQALLARAYANQGQLAQALEYCEKAVAADKLNAGYYYLRATILQEQGAIDEAIGSLKRALYLDHEFVLAHFALGNLARQQSKQSGAGVLRASKHFANALQLLRNYRPTDVLPESEGITAGRLAAIITTMTERESGP